MDPENFYKQRFGWMRDARCLYGVNLPYHYDCDILIEFPDGEFEKEIYQFIQNAVIEDMHWDPNIRHWTWNEFTAILGLAVENNVPDLGNIIMKTTRDVKPYETWDLTYTSSRAEEIFTFESACVGMGKCFTAEITMAKGAGTPWVPNRTIFGIRDLPGFAVTLPCSIAENRS